MCVVVDLSCNPSVTCHAKGIQEGLQAVCCLTFASDQPEPIAAVAAAPSNIARRDAIPGPSLAT